MSKSLERALKQDDAIVFVGSGISRWSGLPSWEAVIGQLATYLRDQGADATLVTQEAENGDLLQAASYGFQKLTQAQIADFIRGVSQTGYAKPAAIHQAIMSLGPTCFITTNYDDLLEQAFRCRQEDPTEPLVVLNTQLLEQAEITHAQARGFIFKPHGDARRADSIVLTREQYRNLLPSGPFSATLETFKTLLQTRPVIFLGFGLRDPDFMYLRDILANIYRGGMRDHYAIVADPVEDQVNYWRTQYGIHLVGYRTSDGGRDHSDLLKLLRGLRSGLSDKNYDLELDVDDASVVLAIARYAASCLTPTSTDKFEIRVRSVVSGQEGHWRKSSYEHWPVEQMLQRGPKRLILLGEPGAGKSFAIKESVNAIASSLQDSCLRGELSTDMRVPVFVDLKLYSGDLVRLIADQFPEGLTLEKLAKKFPVTLYLDSFNEMPRIYKEDGSFDGQLDELLDVHGNIGLVIGARTGDGLTRLDMPTYRLSEVSIEEVESRIIAKGISISQSFRDDIVKILQRPFYFRLIDGSSNEIGAVHSPADLYQHFIDRLLAQFSSDLSTEFDLLTALQRHAYDTLEKGIEAFSVDDLERHISDQALSDESPECGQITNWLAAHGFIVPMKGHRAAFVHQSITEFLAAQQLVNRLKCDRSEVDALIVLRRWDNAIFLALEMLDEGVADEVLRKIVQLDVGFALSAARYVQIGAERQVEQLLETIADAPALECDWSMQLALPRLPLNRSHEAVLRRVLCRPAWRTAAYGGLAKALGRGVKNEIMAAVFEETAYNDLVRLGDILGELLEEDDTRQLLDGVLELDADNLGKETGITASRIEGVARALRLMPAERVGEEVDKLLDSVKEKKGDLIGELVSRLSFHNKSLSLLKVFVRVLGKKITRSTFPIYIMVRFDEGLREKFAAMVDDELFQVILDYLDQGDRWAVDLLLICRNVGSIRKRLIEEIKKAKGFRCKVLKYCRTGDGASLLDGLENANSQDLERNEHYLKLIDFPDINWLGRHSLFISLLARHDLTLARHVLGGSIPPTITGLDEISLGRIEPWVDWIFRLSDDSVEGADWTAEQLATLLAQSQTPDNKEQILSLLDRGTPQQKWVLATMVLRRLDGLTMSDLSAQSEQLLKDMVTSGVVSHGFAPHPFVKLADEEYLRSEILPLALLSEKANKAVASLCRDAGKRLGIRIVVPKLTDPKSSEKRS